MAHLPAVIAGFSGWQLDAFDFFLVTFCLTAIAHDFHKTDAQLALIITVTMLFRPVGAFVFGLLADLYGRRRPLMVSIAIFAVAEVLTGLAPNYTTLLIIRAMFGMVMGGTWGLGASLAMEGAPVKKRGFLSGLFQQGYGTGYVLAALCFFCLYNRLGWRPLFFIGSVPALALVVFLAFRVPESAVWQKRRDSANRLSFRGQWREALSHWKLFLYLLAFMTMMLFASHGTQDMYPTFLQRQWHYAAAQRALITALGGIGGLIGALVVGHFSDRFGRRKAIIWAFALGVFAIPLWAYAPNAPLLVLGAALIQFMVHGAWGVVPAHLAELSPNSVRAMLPGFAYQAAGVIASSVVYIEAVYAQRTSYATAMALTAFSVFVLAIVMTSLGREKRGQHFEE